MREIVLAIGSNEPGAWGCPLATLRRSIDALEAIGMAITAVSPLLETAPVGPSRRPYLNTVVLARTDKGPAEVLRALKRIEWAAGRRARARWSGRTLDIDIIADGGRAVGWQPPGGLRRRTRRHDGAIPGPAETRLVLPHPRAHRRAFVLAPLLHVRPKWRHPVLGLAGRTLLLRVRTKPGDIRVVCDDWSTRPRHGSVAFRTRPCDI